MTTTTGPAPTIHVLVPGPAYGPGFGATTRRTSVNEGGARAGRCRRRRDGGRPATRQAEYRRSSGRAVYQAPARQAASAGRAPTTGTSTTHPTPRPAQHGQSTAAAAVAARAPRR